MPQDGPKIVPRALLAALGRSWTALGPLLAALEPLLAALGSLLVRLGPILEPLGAILGRSGSDLGRPRGDLGAILPLKEGIFFRGGGRGRRHSAAGWSPLETFCRKFLPSRDLKNLLFFRDLRVGFSTRRAALGAADLERPAGGDRRPLRKGSSACSMCEAGVV